jgi:predicted enzyme related to lactoylglutathione lyase
MAGEIVHLELPAGDTSRSRQFWSSLFGWQFQAFEGPTEYHMTQLSDTQGAAVLPAEGNGRAARPYFSVDDVNAGVARVRELGGQADNAMPVPGMGWFATCQDSEGTAFGLWQTDPSAPAPSQ